MQREENNGVLLSPLKKLYLHDPRDKAVTLQAVRNYKNALLHSALDSKTSYFSKKLMKNVKFMTQFQLLSSIIVQSSQSLETISVVEFKGSNVSDQEHYPICDCKTDQIRPARFFNCAEPPEHLICKGKRRSTQIYHP